MAGDFGGRTTENDMMRKAVVVCQLGFTRQED